MDSKCLRWLRIVYSLQMGELYYIVKARAIVLLLFDGLLQMPLV
jgi:hypothetical protein